MSHYGATSGAMEFELLTRTESFVWTWDADSPAVANVAAGDVERAVTDWHVDHTWETKPGPHCPGAPSVDGARTATFGNPRRPREPPSPPWRPTLT